MKLKTIIFIIDILIAVTAFGILYYVKTEEIFLSRIYFTTFIIYLPLWILFSRYYKKYSLLNKVPYRQIVKSIIWSAALTLFFMAGIVVLTDLKTISRQFILLIVFIPMIIEILLVGTISILKIYQSNTTIENIDQSNDHNSIVPNSKWIMFSAFMLIALFFIMIKIHIGHFAMYPWSELILFLLLFSWLISLLLTKKYAVNPSHNIYYAITPFIKSGIIMFLISAVIFFFFRTELLSRFILFGTIFAFTLCETIIQIVYYFSIPDKKNVQPILPQQNDISSQYKIKKNINKNNSSNLNQKLDFESKLNKIKSLPNRYQIIDFLKNELQTKNIDEADSTIISAISIENIEILNNNSRELLINFHRLNDMRRLNQYLIECHNKIRPEGYLVGNLEPLETNYLKLKHKMPKMLFAVLYPLYFTIFRVFPKIPILNKLYFAITQGKNRIISKYELYGRLNFCGFQIEKDILIDDKLYFITKKIRSISINKNPSYHPIVKLQRVGLHGNKIFIHKFRTMHPYSEFIQKDIYQIYGLDNTGNKIQNDPRITTWGKIMRQYWIDELPQLIDWVQGRLTLVGVRALSVHYHSLYPKDLQEFRTKYKPGIIPPYYADLPQNLEEKFASEKRYLLQKTRYPIRTDLKYCFAALSNIVIRGARSK